MRRYLEVVVSSYMPLPCGEKSLLRLSLTGVKIFGIHVRWVKHDVVDCTVPSIGHVRSEGKARIEVNQPMGDVIFVHELYSFSIQVNSIRHNRNYKRLTSQI